MSNSKRNRRRGKAVQKRVVENLGGMNIGSLGGEDGFHKDYSIEVKSRKKCVVTGWFDQADANNKRKVTPMVILHITGKRSGDDIVMLRYKDFKKIMDISE